MENLLEKREFYDRNSDKTVVFLADIKNNCFTPTGDYVLPFPITRGRFNKFCSCKTRDITWAEKNISCEICKKETNVLTVGNCTVCESNVCINCRIERCGWYFESDANEFCQNCIAYGFNSHGGNNNGRCMNCCAMPFVDGIGCNATCKGLAPKDISNVIALIEKHKGSFIKKMN